MKKIAIFLAALFCFSTLDAQVFCPSQTGAFVPECASMGAGACPTQTECVSGWQWASPSAPIASIPQAIVSGPGNHPQIVVCYLAGQQGPKCAETLPSVSLRTWCETLKSLPWPAGVTVEPLMVGVCGSTIPKGVRQGLKRGLKSPDRQVRDASLWVLERM